MFTCVKKTLLVTIVALILPLMFGGCQKKIKTASCKEDTDCRVDASGKEINGVCVLGVCGECREDTDCTGLKQCINNRCESSCQADADCGANKHCEESYCVADCSDNAACTGDRVCAKGRCVAEMDFNGEKMAVTEEDCKNIPNIHFGFDKFEIEKEYRPQVEKLARCMEVFPGLSITIEGHTDEQGTPAYNMILAERRAGAVLSFLKNMGIASARIKTVAYGEQQPLVKESNENAYAQNRRAKFNFIN